MSLFGSRRRTYVGSAVSPLYERYLLSDLPSTAVFSAVVQNQSIPATLVDEINAGIGNQTNQAFEFAKEGGTEYGLADHEFVSDTVGIPETKVILNAIAGEPTTIAYSHLNTLHHIHYGFGQVETLYGYNDRTNELEGLSVTHGFPCYLENLVGVINTDVTEFATAEDLYEEPEYVDMQLWEIAPNNRPTPWVNPEASETYWALSDTEADHCVLLYAYMSDTPKPGTQSETNQAAYDAALLVKQAEIDAAKIAFEATGNYTEWYTWRTLEMAFANGTAVPKPELFDEDYMFRETVVLPTITEEIEANYFHVKYYYASGVKHFTYKKGLGTYPTLDDLNEVTAGDPEFMPFIFFKEDGVYKDSDTSSAAYTGYEEYCDTIGLDYQETMDSIRDQEDGTVQEAILQYGIDLETHEEIGRKYLFEFFKWMNLNANQLSETSEFMSVSNLTGGAFGDDNDFVSRELINRGLTLSDGNFNMQVNFGGLSHKIQNGTFTHRTYNLDDTGEEGDITYKTSEVGDYAIDKLTTTLTYYIYRNEVIDNQEVRTAQPIDKEVFIYKFRKQISDTQYEELTATGIQIVQKIGGKDAFINTKEEEAKLIMPLSYQLVQDHFDTIDQDRLYAHSMHLVFNSRVVKKIPWYATFLFRGLMIIAAVVITVVSLGSALGPLASTFSATAATSGIVAATAGLIYGVAVGILKSVIASAVFELVAAELGAEFSVVVGVLATIGALYGIKSNATWATNLMTYSTSLVNAGNNEFKNQTIELIREQAEFNELMEGRWEELEEANRELNPNISTDPTLFIGQVPLEIPGESPTSFYNRTIHAGNVGAASFDYIHNHVEATLRLPTFQDTIGGFS